MLFKDEERNKRFTVFAGRWIGAGIVGTMIGKVIGYIIVFFMVKWFVLLVYHGLIGK